jgi:predicted ATPase/class 3 adenylate cyclase
VANQESSRLPTGIVTFLFTDIEGSTAMVQRLGRAVEDVFAEHDLIVRGAILAASGTVVRTEGDAFFAVFTSPAQAIEAAIAAQQSLQVHEWPKGEHVRVRMGAHTGEGRSGGDDYVGIDVHRAARIAAAGHGGQILVSETTQSLAADSLRHRVSFRDLGRHRLKDLDSAQHIFQIVLPGSKSDFPPIRTGGSPTTLPAEFSEFVGRDDEVSAVSRLIADHRIVTLTGAGGTGKTRLAVHVATAVSDSFPDGVHFIGLDEVTDPALALSTIARVIGSTGDLDPTAAIGAIIGRGTVLLVLDNLEHIVEAAPRLAHILTMCPGVTILATSQIRLRIRGEQVFRVPPLGLPVDEDTLTVSQSDSGMLFEHRAREIEPSFILDDSNAGTVAAILQRLEGLPLAIELAVARLPLFGIEGLLTELESSLADPGAGFADAPERHRTLAAAVQWSYGLLTELERSLLRSASVFVGGFSLDAAKAVCRGGDGLDVVGTLAALMDKSLVRSTVGAGSPRFSMLEAIRSFGLARLTEAGEEHRIRRAHAEYFTAMPRAESSSFRGPDGYAAMKRLTMEEANIATALAWATEHDPELGLSALLVLARFYAVSGSLDEGWKTAERLLASPAAITPQSRLPGLLGAASIAYWLLDYSGAESLYLEAMDIAEGTDDEASLIEALFGLAYTYVWLQRTGDAEASIDRAMRIATKTDDEIKKAHLLAVRGTCSWMRGNLRESMVTFADVARRSEELGDTHLELSGYRVLAGGLVRASRFEAAVTFLLDILDRCDALGDDAGLIETLDYLAVAVAGMDPRQGVRLGAAIRAITDRRGGTVLMSVLGIPDPRTIAASTLAGEEIDRLWSEGRSLDLDDVKAVVRLWAASLGLEPARMDADTVLELLPD